MTQNEVVTNDDEIAERRRRWQEATVPRGPREMAPQSYSFAEIERLADYIAKSRLFGLATREQAIVMMSIAQAEGRHPAQAAKDYNIIQGRPAKTAEAMQRDFMQAGGRVEWHDLSDDIAAATFSHPQGGSIRILWDMSRAGKAGLSGKDMWKKYPRQMLRARCVSEGVKTIYPAATSGFYTPEEVRDMPAATALPEAAADTTADLDQFAAVAGDAEPPPEWDPIAEVRRASEHGADGFRAFWRTLMVADRERIKLHFGSDLEELKAIAKQADDPFGLPPLPNEGMPIAPDLPVTEPEQPVVGRDVFAELDHEARAATKEGAAGLAAWWKTLRKADKELLQPFKAEYERLAEDTDAQRGLAL